MNHSRLTNRAKDALVEVLTQARSVGMLGPGPVEQHVEHAVRFAELIAPALSDGGRWLDLGSGGGVPGLVVALVHPASCGVLLDSRQQRAEFLRSAVEQLGLGERVTVVGERAEDAGRGADRNGFVAVTARGFGPPAVTAECAAPLLQLGGLLVVSEPPGAPDRWPEDGLAKLGLSLRRRLTDPSFVVIESVEPCPQRFPRRVGIVAKRPLF